MNLAARSYSPERVEGKFSEVRRYGVLGSSHNLDPTPMGVRG
jgi:hypothetical protein